MEASSIPSGILDIKTTDRLIFRCYLSETYVFKFWFALEENKVQTFFQIIADKPKSLPQERTFTLALLYSLRFMTRIKPAPEMTHANVQIHQGGIVHHQEIY